jgi:hypothetical protein
MKDGCVQPLAALALKLAFCFNGFSCEGASQQRRNDESKKMCLGMDLSLSFSKAMCRQIQTPCKDM